MIGVEWGHGILRAWRLGPDGAIRDRRSSARGLLAVPDFRFSDMLREELGRWVAGGEDRVLICGPAGGTQGWRSARPAPCATPCGVAELAGSLMDVPFDWAQVKLIPGARHDDDATGTSETMNGEETHLLGAAAAIGGTGLLCMPGATSCWAQLDGGRITRLQTHLTGDAFTALRASVLGRTARDAPLDSVGFERGVARSGRPGGLLRHLAELRAEATLPDAVACLNGLLVGHEVRAALTLHAEIHLVGSPDQATLHARAIAACAGTALPPLADPVVAGLALVGAHADWR